MLAAVIICAAVTFSANATGYLVFSDSFDTGFSGNNWHLTESEFRWDEEGRFICGYGSAHILETNYTSETPIVWDQFYASFDVKVCGFDDPELVEENHTVGLGYRDLFENEEESRGAVYEFVVSVETGNAYIKKTHTFKYRDGNGILNDGEIKDSVLCSGKIDDAIKVGENASWFNLGMRVTEGQIEGYYNGELVCSAKADPESEKLGNFSLTAVDETVGTQRSPILVVSGTETAKLRINIDNFEVWSPDYDVPGIQFGDVNGNGKINLEDVAFSLKYIAKWKIDSFDRVAADVNSDGKVNLRDVSMMLKFLIKWGPTAPAPDFNKN